jgi:hypothetical protein
VLEEFYNLYSSLSYIEVSKVGENECRSLIEESEGKIPFNRHGHRW